MPRFIDRTGQRFGMLVVVRLATKLPTKWECLCDCGGRGTPLAGALQSGNTKSCGCRKRNVLGESTTTHGMAGTRTHRIWRGMRTRCTNPNTKSYKDYGARGITICKRWDKFENFLADMGECPEGLSLERRENDKGYSKGNCYWATREEQNRNARSNVNLTFKGKTQCATAWAREVGIAKETLRQRLNRGWSVEDAVTRPPRAMRRKGKALHLSSMRM